MEEFSVVFMKRFRSNWFKKTKGRHVTYNTRQSVLRRKRIYVKKSSKPRTLEDTFNDLLSNIQKPLVIASIPLLANGIWMNFLLLS
jgi:hypothetical protein